MRRPVSIKRGKPPGARRISPVFTDKNPAPGRVSSPQNVAPTMPQQRPAPRMKIGMPPKRGARRFAEGGAVYEVNGQRVTKEQYEQAGKDMNTPKSKAEEEMMDFAKAAKERAKARAQSKTAPVNKAKGGEAKKKPPGLYANIHAKRKRIAAGSNEKMRKVRSKGAPTKAAFIKSAKTARKG